MGTVVRFGTPQYTAYPYHGVAGMHRLNIARLIFYLQFYNYFLSSVFDINAPFKQSLKLC